MLLVPADLRTRHAKVAQEYMAGKGYPSIRPLGLHAVEGDECWYFYYQLPEGLLELEVFFEPTSNKYRRRVAAFLTDRARIRDLLSS
jgi:hypothetical protein